MTDVPGWITAVSPQQGQLRPNREQQVRVTTNRAGLNLSGGSHRFIIRSNDPVWPALPLDVHVRVPYSIIIGVRPTSLNFGRTASTVAMDIANMGDAGYPLDFVVTSSQPEWLFVEPETGRSMGVSGPLKDWRSVSVAIDRGRITNQGAAAKLIITAENVPANASPVEPVEVPVSVDIAELTIETAFPRMRPPSLMRLALLLRDSRQHVFSPLEDYFVSDCSQFRINSVVVDMLEDSVPLDLDETNVQVKKDESLSFAVLVMLDYSASMLEAAQALVDDGQLDPGALNPLDALYQQTIAPMLAELPDHYRVALGVFNERTPDLRIILGAPAGYTEDEAFEDYVTDKAILQYRLANTGVQDNGATPLYPAVIVGAVSLYNIDWTLPDFDAVAERILIAVTDGRNTTPPGDLNLVKETLFAARVRFMCIGFGNQVQANPLIQMSTESGGHYYSTDVRVIPDSLGPDNKPLTIPILSSLLKWCRTEPGNPLAQSLPRDLRSHVVVSYPSLNEETAISIQGRVEVREIEPSVKETFIFDQVPMLLIANDVKLGQIGMRTEGIQPDGSAAIRVYADYMPRNIKNMTISFTTDPPLAGTVSLVDACHGGMVHDWLMNVEPGKVTLTTQSGRALTYGDYGALFDIRFSDVAAPFTLFMTVDDPVIGGSMDGKYFTYPEDMRVGYEPFTATSFPNPSFAFSPDPIDNKPIVIDVGDLLDDEVEHVANVLVDNVGGEHLPTDATLYWRLRQGVNRLPGTRLGALEFAYNGPEPLEGDYYLIHRADTGFINPPAVQVEDDGSIVPAPDVYSREFFIDVYYGSLNMTFTHGPYYLKYEVIQPENE